MNKVKNFFICIMNVILQWITGVMIFFIGMCILFMMVGSAVSVYMGDWTFWSICSFMASSFIAWWFGHHIVTTYQVPNKNKINRDY